MTGATAEGDAPAVTVVVPTRGRRELVRAAVTSVVGQHYDGHVDCIVVHDQEEPDLALESLSGPDRRVVVMANDATPGLAGSRNAGLAKADADFVASCDDDDAWLPDKLRLQMQRLAQNPQMLVVGAGIRLLMPENRVVDWVGSDDVVTQKLLLRSRRKELHSSTLLMHRRVFDLVGGYDENLPNSYAEDYEFLLRAVRFGAIGVVRQPLATIKKDGTSWFREREEVVAEALEYLLRTHPELATNRAGHARILGQIAFAKASLGERREALRWAGRSLVRWPVAPQAGLALVQVTTGSDPRWLLAQARRVGRGLS